MYRSPALLIALAVAAGLGCGSAADTGSTRLVRVDVPAGWSGLPVRVAYGASWVTSTSRSAAVGPGGGVWIPAEAHAATAFVDTDGDGQLTPFFEPSSRCTLRDDWACELTELQVLARRLTSRHGEDVRDALHIVGQAFDPLDASPLIDATLCGLEASGCAAAENDDVFRGSHPGTRVLSRCVAGDSDPEGVVLSVEGRHTEFLSHPLPSMSLSITRTTSTLQIESALRIDRALVWLARADAASGSEVFWISEDAPSALAKRNPTTVTLRIDDIVRHRCNDCQLVVQVAHDSVDGTSEEHVYLAQKDWQ